MTVARRPRVGFDKVKVTRAGRLGSLGVHDDLHARVMHLAADDGPALVVSLDHMGLSPGQSVAVKSRLARACGIAADRIVIFYTHTHAGVEFRAAALAELLARAAERARDKAGPAEIAYTKVDVDRRYSVNRRAELAHGLGAVSIIFNRNISVDLRKGTEEVGRQIRDLITRGVNIWGTNYLEPDKDPDRPSRPLSPKQADLLGELPEQIYLDGPVDSDLEWLAFRGERGRWLGSIVRFSAHPVIWRKTITGLISADYPGVFCAHMEDATDGAPALFVNGPCGNVKPLYPRNTEEEMDRVGGSLARELLRRGSHLSWRALGRALLVERKERFPVHDDVRKHAGRWPVEEAAARFHHLARRGDDPIAMKRALDWSLRCWGNAAVGWRRPTISLPFHLLAFDDIALLGMPTEVWCEVGLSVKAATHDKRVIVGALCDACTNYVPVSGALSNGGYEAVNSMLDDSAAGRFAAIGTALANDSI